jgi:3'(2'), 5'-bisphosphate nucleotidase
MWEEELKSALKAGWLAENEIMKIYQAGFDVEIKEDLSPVTLADKHADQIIRDVLKEAFPRYSFLTEESEDDLSRLTNDYVWIVDPVDGTKDFVAKNDEFTTNIALSYKHEVVVGVIIIPAKHEAYYAIKGQGSFHIKDGKISKIHVNFKTEGLTMLTSRFHFNDNEKAILEKYPHKITHRETFGSSIKACRIAEGLAEVSYRLSSGTKEWDTAASQIIVCEAGGLFVKPDGLPMKYNRPDVYNREGYVIANRRENILL